MAKTTFPAWAVVPKEEKHTAQNTAVYTSRAEARKWKDKDDKIVKAEVVIK